MAIPGDFDPISKPLSLAVGTKDSLLDMDSIGKIQDLLAKKTEVPHELQVRLFRAVVVFAWIGDKQLIPSQIYEDQVHGFALRSDWSSEKDKKAMDDAQKQGVAWFSKYLA